jgi:hypothetical protein
MVSDEPSRRVAGLVSDYQEEWSDYRKRRNRFVLVFLTYVPVVGVSMVVTGRLIHTATPGIALAIGWMVLFAVTGIRLQRFPCPRCGEAFFARGIYHNIFARKCLNCGLAKYSGPTF